MTVEPGETSLEVSDLALAKLAARAAISVPGVLRLAPRLSRVVQSALTNLARSLTTPDQGAPDHVTADQGAADPGAIEVERGTAGPTTVTVRIIATGEPSVLQTVDGVSDSVHRVLLDSAVGMEVVVVVVVVDTEPGR